MGPADSPDCGKEKIQSKKRTRLKLITGAGIAAVLITLAIILVNYFGSPVYIAKSMFYNDFPGTPIINVSDAEYPGQHRVVWISFYTGSFVHGRYYDVIAYDFVFIDNRWIFEGRIME